MSFDLARFALGRAQGRFRPPLNEADARVMHRRYCVLAKSEIQDFTQRLEGCGATFAGFIKALATQAYGPA